MPIRMRMEGLYLTVHRTRRRMLAYLAFRRGSFPDGSLYRNPLDILDFLVPVVVSACRLTGIFRLRFRI